MRLEIADDVVDGHRRRAWRPGPGAAPGLATAVKGGLALAVFTGIAIAAAGCQFHAEEPRQRQDYSDPPVQYGETRFSGMALPNPDAGPPAAR